MRKNVWKIAGLVAIVLTLASGAVVSAQVWKPFEFSVAERYEFEVQTMEYSWDGHMLSRQFSYTLGVRPSGNFDANGDELFHVFIGTERAMAGEKLSEHVSWGGMMDGFTFVFGNPLESMMILAVFDDIELEVGERTNIFGFGRVIVTEEVLIAGRKAVVVVQEQGEAGNRTKTAEWIVDGDLAVPVGVRTFDSEGRVTQETMLVKYERL